MEKFTFLKSVRFWKIVAIGVLQALIAVGVVHGTEAESLTQIIQLILGSSVAVRTVDRFGEKSGSKDTE